MRRQRTTAGRACSGDPRGQKGSHPHTSTPTPTAACSCLWSRPATEHSRACGSCQGARCWAAAINSVGKTRGDRGVEKDNGHLGQRAERRSARSLLPRCCCEARRADSGAQTRPRPQICSGPICPLPLSFYQIDQLIDRWPRGWKCSRVDNPCEGP